MFLRLCNSIAFCLVALFLVALPAQAQEEETTPSPSPSATPTADRCPEIIFKCTPETVDWTKAGSQTCVSDGGYYAKLTTVRTKTIEEDEIIDNRTITTDTTESTLELCDPETGDTSIQEEEKETTETSVTLYKISLPNIAPGAGGGLMATDPRTGYDLTVSVDKEEKYYEDGQATTTESTTTIDREEYYADWTFTNGKWLPTYSVSLTHNYFRDNLAGYYENRKEGSKVFISYDAVGNWTYRSTTTYNSDVVTVETYSRSTNSDGEWVDCVAACETGEEIDVTTGTTPEVYNGSCPMWSDTANEEGEEEVHPACEGGQSIA